MPLIRAAARRNLLLLLRCFVVGGGGGGDGGGWRVAAFSRSAGPLDVICGGALSPVAKGVVVVVSAALRRATTDAIWLAGGGVGLHVLLEYRGGRTLAQLGQFLLLILLLGMATLHITAVTAGVLATLHISRGIPRCKHVIAFAGVAIILLSSLMIFTAVLATSKTVPLWFLCNRFGGCKKHGTAQAIAA